MVPHASLFLFRAFLRKTALRRARVARDGLGIRLFVRPIAQFGASSAYAAKVRRKLENL
jgi:hypothetical protein